MRHLVSSELEFEHVRGQERPVENPSRTLCSLLAYYREFLRRVWLREVPRFSKVTEPSSIRPDFESPFVSCLQQWQNKMPNTHS